VVTRQQRPLGVGGGRGWAESGGAHAVSSDWSAGGALPHLRLSRTAEVRTRSGAAECAATTTTRAPCAKSLTTADHAANLAQPTTALPGDIGHYRGTGYSIRANYSGSHDDVRCEPTCSGGHRRQRRYW
jgi:hypothetical protein